MKKLISSVVVVGLSILGIILTLGAIGTTLLVISAAVGLGRDHVVGFADNKYIIGRPPTSYNLYEKNSGTTILDNIIGYKTENGKTYVFSTDSSYIVIDEEKESYLKKEVEERDARYDRLLKEMERLE
ncbi:hypothetical protein [Priestia flexa]|uniref:Uncharacterized protein n=1 Tax=Priestia flexa TaxID=86664 RepID=A0ABU4JB38_9BACI|nr:hypothetical protein [Priestia flexa]MCA1201360.1 hypothetical protein [Priestia flexa]MCM3065798.1 hypothetical protein [Priestia flexa]MDW8518220.1 hypothetical protein [Priestia flexa]MED4591144.1 hypothetical protein [Priestia flexa]